MRNILQKQRRDALNIEIRTFQTLSDLPSVLDTENACGEGNWDERTVADFHFRQDAVMKVATLPESRYVVGHVCVTIASEVWLRRLAVKPSFRRRGIGATLLRDALEIARRRRIAFKIPVRENDLAMQVWLRNRGFRCFRIGTDYHPGETTYWFGL